MLPSEVGQEALFDPVKLLERSLQDHKLANNFAWGVVDLSTNEITEIEPTVGAFRAISRKKDA